MTLSYRILYLVFSLPTIVSCTGTFILCKIDLFWKMLTVLCSGRLIGKCSSMLTNVTHVRVTWDYSYKHILHDYTLHQQSLEHFQFANYLGITITENIDWDQHISEISSKAIKTLCFLRRNLAFAPRSTKE